MSHPFGSDGPHFRRARQRDRFPSLIDGLGVTGDGLVSKMGSSSTADMESLVKEGGLTTSQPEKRAGHPALDANVPPHRLYLRSTSRGLRRAIDIFLPRFQPDGNLVSSDGDQLSEDNVESSSNAQSISVAQETSFSQLPAAPRQLDEI
ncbi:uncharacterized protein LOC108034148 [Drosophila biarmipes]|uniref:uncharacterized protein LOC108034148 n=1 Tax=Drosophila biarmipes TaxID=125945 RepID=UPI0007E6E65B|nr:uncharacterized protein LOC108034148 [Drosophila biarmipes]